MRKTLLFMALGAFAPLLAQQPTSSICPFPAGSTVLHGNALYLDKILPGTIIQGALPVSGSTGSTPYSPPLTPGLPVPGLPLAYGLDQAGLWVGARDTAGAIRVSASRAYANGLNRPSAFVPGPLAADGLPTAQSCQAWDRFWTVRGYEIDLHRADLADGALDAPLPAVVGWPGRDNPHFAGLQGFALPAGDLAPFVDADGDGVYNAFNGDYPHPAGLSPDVTPRQISWCRYNDRGGPTSDYFFPVGADYQLTAWALACTDHDLLNHTLFFNQKITNRSGQWLDSVVVGMANDFTLGATYDDAWGTAPALHSTFAYNRQPVDYPWAPLTLPAPLPVLAWTALNVPLYKSMPVFTSAGACAPPPQVFGPENPLEYYRFLHGRWRGGEPLHYGNYGYAWNAPVVLTDYVFPGIPYDTAGWSLDGTTFLCPGYFALLGSVYAGALAPDASFAFDFAYSYHRDTQLTHVQNVLSMYPRVAQLRAEYDAGFAGVCNVLTCVGPDCVWPGDTNRDGTVNHLDLFPIWVKEGATGLLRDAPVFWQPQIAVPWNDTFANTFDIKHIDASGDGLIDTTDGQVVRALRHSTIPGYVPPDDLYESGTAIFGQVLAVRKVVLWP